MLERMHKAELREQKRQAVEAKKAAKKPKPVVSEQDLVHRYVNRTISNARYHGRIDKDKFEGMGYEKSVSKNLWLDTDFFFSVVFQSREQKWEFLEKWEAIHGSFEDDIVPPKIQIVNGLKLAKALGIELKLETVKNYPTGNIDLLPFILDNTEV